MKRDRIILGVSILLAFLMWLPQKLTKNYRHTVPLKISIALPKDRQLVDDKVKIFPVEISGKGSQLYSLTGNIKTDTLFLPLNSRALRTQYSAERILAYFSETYSIPQDIVVRPIINTLDFTLDSVAVKVVPVRLPYKLSFAPGYGKVGEPILSPDHITISGPHHVVDNIDFIVTDSLHVDDLNKTETIYVNLSKTEKFEALTFSNERISATIDIDELVEKDLIVPLGKFEDDLKVYSLFPDQVFVRLSVPLRYLKDVNETDIKVKLNSQGNQAVSVEIKEVPIHSRYINHSPKILRYFEQEADSLQ